MVGVWSQSRLKKKKLGRCWFRQCWPYHPRLKLHIGALHAKDFVCSGDDGLAPAGWAKCEWCRCSCRGQEQFWKKKLNKPDRWEQKTRARERERERERDGYNIYIYGWVGWSDQWLIILIDWMGCISCDLFFLGNHLSIGITLQDVIASLWRGLITWTRYQVLLSRIQARRHPWGQNPMNMKGKLKGKELLWHRLIASV